MKLDIIVPHYNESIEVCRPLFDSIALQRGINFDDLRVILVNDGNNVLPSEVFKDYPYEVITEVCEHNGVSATRNRGLELSDADYVMFCDCDDMFLNSCGLHLVFSGMNEGHEVIVSAFIEEQYDENGIYHIVNHDTTDGTFIHGKVFKRQFLVDNNIKFDEKLSIHEDGYFVCLALTVADNKRAISTPFYMWCWNENSTVRKDRKDFVLKTYSHLIKCRKALCKQLFERGYIDEYLNAVCKTVFDSYYDFNKPDYLDSKNADLVKSAEKAFRKFYIEFGQDYVDADINRKAEIMYLSRTTAFANGMRVEHITIKEWLKHIKDM